MTAGSPEEGSYRNRLQELREEIEQRAGKSAGELLQQREKRLSDAIELKEPDRIPVIIGSGNFAARYKGVPLSAAYYDVAAYQLANIEAMVDFEPDAFRGFFVGSGGAMESLDTRTARWPGGNLPPNVPYQFVEGEYMKEDEYDIFLADPTDFTLRYHLPRMYGVLAPLGKMPPLRNLAGMGLPALAPMFASPPFQKLAQALLTAGQAQAQWNSTARSFEDEVSSLGFPMFAARFGVGAGQVPFDSVSDFYRGMRGSMIDMYRRPEKLLAMCDKILECRLATLPPLDPNMQGSARRVFMPLHRGAEGFMSREQFEKFYWPGLKKIILKNTEMGLISMPFFEGKCDARLEYILELPKGKVVCHFDRSDMKRAKEILGGHSCIMGNVPASLLQVGSPPEVEECCKDLIKTCGRGGGFILAPGGPIDEAKPENIRTMVESVRKYR
jgi:hypothetical protein